MDREPAAWETGAAGPILTVGDVSLWALVDQRFRVESTDDSREVEGFQQAQQLAHELAAV